MKTKLRRALSVLAISPLVIAASCSSDPKKRGQIMIAVSSDLSVPANMDEVVVEVVSEDGEKQSLTYLVKPNEPGKPLPGTVAVVPPNSGGQRLRVRVIGQLNKGTAEARVLREALVVVPRDRVGLLHMPIRWLCDGQLFQDADTKAVTSTCETDTQTCKAGSCVDADLTAVELPEYEPEAVYGGGNEDGEGGACFDVPSCFDKGVTVQVGTDCTLPLPSGGEGVSVGVVPTDRRRGICREGDGVGDCYIPIDRDDEDGWSEAGGRIQLPTSLCNGPKASQVSRVVVTTACATKSLGTPICGPWTNVKSVAPVGPQTPPIGSGGDGDGGVIARPDGSVDVPPDGGAGGGSVTLPPAEAGTRDEAGTCVGEGQVLNQAPAGAMFILLDGSSQMMETGGTVPSSVSEWLAAAAVRTPALGIGLGVAMNTCGDPPSQLFPVMPAGSGFDFGFGEFGMGDFPLEEGLFEARGSLSRWPQAPGGGSRQAIIVISAQGPLQCLTDTVAEVANGFVQEGVSTHVLSPGPGAAILGDLAIAGGTGGVVTFSDAISLHSVLDNIATGLVRPCAFQAPPGGPGAATVTLQNPDLGRVVLEYRGDLGCSDTPGYIPDPLGDPGYIHLCPTTCAELQRTPATQVVAEVTGSCLPPLQGAGGAAGIGGSPGQGGSASIPKNDGGFGEGGRAGFGGSDGLGGTPGSAGAGSDSDGGFGGPGGGSGQGGAPAADAGVPPLRCAPQLCPTPPQGVACCITPDGPCDGDQGTGCGCPTLPPVPFDPCPFDGQRCSYEGGTMCDCFAGEGWMCAMP